MSSIPLRDRKRLVSVIAERLRERILKAEPDTRIGSLGGLAADLDVGIVTVQQAARVLEHEGLLTVRRGPGGGYYAQRPDEAALERAIAAYVRVHPGGSDEALDIVTLLFCELAAAAAASSGEASRRPLEALLERVDGCVDSASRGAFEVELQNLLFQMVNRPMFELLTRVAFRLYAAAPGDQPLIESESWRAARKRIIAAILSRDAELARFESLRVRRTLMGWDGLRL